MSDNIKLRIARKVRPTIAIGFSVAFLTGMFFVVASSLGVTQALIGFAILAGILIFCGLLAWAMTWADTTIEQEGKNDE